MSGYNDTSMNDGFNIGDVDSFGLLLPGSITITGNVNDVDGFQNDVLVRSNDTTRLQVIKARDPTYYIRVPFDINSKIICHPNDTANDGNDDAWQLQAITITKTELSASDITYQLPADSAQPQIATINFNDGDTGASIQSVPLYMNLTHAANSTITATATFATNNGGIFTGGGGTTYTVDTSSTENMNDAQKKFFDLGGAGATAPTENDVDQLSATVTVSQLDTYFNDEIADVLTDFNNLSSITNFSINFPELPAMTNSNLSMYGRANNVGVSNDLFNENDQIVTENAASFSLTFNDSTNTERTLVSSVNVYGVIYQKESEVAS